MLSIQELYVEQLLKERVSLSYPTLESKYVEESFSDLVARGIPERKIFDIIDSIYDEYPSAVIESPDDGSNDYGDAEKWNRLLVHYPQLFRMISERNSENYVAYWMVLSITDELYDRTVAGENINKECDYMDTHGFFVPRDHNIYIVDMFTRKNYLDRIPLNRVIRDGFFSLVQEMAEHGHFIKRIVTHAAEVRSEKLCNDLRLEPVCNHKYHRRYRSETDKTLIPAKIYAVDLSKGDLSILAHQSDPMLINRYMEHFGIVKPS